MRDRISPQKRFVDVRVRQMPLQKVFARPPSTWVTWVDMAGWVESKRSWNAANSDSNCSRSGPMRRRAVVGGRVGGEDLVEVQGQPVEIQGCCHCRCFSGGGAW